MGCTDIPRQTSDVGAQTSVAKSLTRDSAACRSSLFWNNEPGWGALCGGVRDASGEAAAA